MAQASKSRSTFLVGVCVTFQIVAIHSAGASPSFNCSNASYLDEKTICASAELSALELTASILFERALNVDQAKARLTARDFLGKRHNCGGDSECIRNLLQSAASAYQQLIETATAAGTLNRNDEVQIDDATRRKLREQAADISFKAAFRCARQHVCTASQCFAPHNKWFSSDRNLVDDAMSYFSKLCGAPR